MFKRLGVGFVLALAMLLPAAATQAVSPSFLSPGNSVTTTANTCLGPTLQRNWFRLVASVGDASDANKIRVTSHVISRTPPSTTFTVVHVYPTVEVNLNHNRTSLAIPRTWRGPSAQRTRIVVNVQFVHGNSVVASAKRISVAC